jgi:hypothetical protein
MEWRSRSLRLLERARTGFGRADAINIRIPIEGAEKTAKATASQPKPGTAYVLMASYLT